jgi:hypothetical protein
MASGTRKRSPNFSENALQTLLKEVEKNRSILFSKLSSVTTNSSKKCVWESICATLGLSPFRSELIIYHKQRKGSNSDLDKILPIQF